MSRRDRKRRAIQGLLSLGYEFQRRAKHCLIFTHPCGATVAAAGTPGDHRSDMNLLADARRQLRIHTKEN